MSKLLRKTILAATCGLSFGAAAYAADSSTYRYPAEYQAARAKCDGLTATEQARCIVNIRPTPAANGASAADSGANIVKDGAERDEVQALKECEPMTGDDRQRCVEKAKERNGRM